MNAATVEPSPGSAPVSVPMAELRKSVGSNALCSFPDSRLSSGSEENVIVFSARRLTGCSSCLKTSEMARNPISMGIRPIPSNNSALPKVRRGEPVIGSSPMQASRTPAAIAATPFQELPRCSEIRLSSAKNTRIAYSAGPNRIATAARTPAPKIRTMSENESPNTEANRTVCMAFPPFPRRARGLPSMTVAAAAGVPGVRSRMAGMLDPNRDPLNMASIIGIPTQGSK